MEFINIEKFHKENEEKYKGKITNKGIITEIKYLTYGENPTGEYNRRPKEGKKGLIVGVIGTKFYPISELLFLN